MCHPTRCARRGPLRCRHRLGRVTGGAPAGGRTWGWEGPREPGRVSPAACTVCTGGPSSRCCRAGLLGARQVPPTLGAGEANWALGSETPARAEGLQPTIGVTGAATGPQHPQCVGRRRTAWRCTPAGRCTWALGRSPKHTGIHALPAAPRPGRGGSPPGRL